MPEPLSSKKTPDTYKEKRHKFYGQPWVVEAIDKLAALNKANGRLDQTRSDLIENALRKILRLNAPRLRKIGVLLPDELWEKISRSRRLTCRTASGARRKA